MLKINRVPFKNIIYIMQALMNYIPQTVVHFSSKVDQNWKKAKSEAGSNIAQNDSKWALIVLSSHILVHFSSKVDQN